jgi:predicted AlkP superfamily pyrophosphatase or phosphodiesterase
VIRTRKPNLLLFHPLDVDATHHKYGALTGASEIALAFADDRLKEIVDADASGMRGRTTIFVVSDHGFRSAAKNIHPNVALRAAGIRCAYTVPEAGSPIPLFHARDNRKTEIRMDRVTAPRSKRTSSPDHVHP